MITFRAKWAFEKGYRVRGNKIIGPNGKERKTNRNSNTANGYPRFNIWHRAQSHTVKCHQLAAWQKYGPKCIGVEIHVRHLDDDPNNFKLDNIELGSAEDNRDDKYINAIIGEWIEQINAEAEIETYEAANQIPF